MEVKQTAVEWFNKEINKLNVGTDARVFIDKLFQQAKEIEKEQRIKGYQLGYDTGYKVCEMKFNGLFKSE